jgi:hypothetical protein
MSSIIILKTNIMKKVMRLFRFALIAVILMLASCSKSSDNNSPSPATSNDLKTSLSQGTWVITSYTQKTEDKTSQFAGATFTFSKSGTLTVNQNGSTASGTWAYTPSAVGYYGGPPSNASVNINLGNQSPFNRLSRIWNVESSSSTVVSLLNPEPVENERVKFERQ